VGGAKGGARISAVDFYIARRREGEDAGEETWLVGKEQRHVGTGLRSKKTIRLAFEQGKKEPIDYQIQETRGPYKLENEVW